MTTDVALHPTADVAARPSALSIAAFVLAALGLRRHGWRPVACAVAAGLVADLVLSAVLLVASGLDEPLAPITLLPAELIVGIALLVGTRR